MKKTIQLAACLVAAALMTVAPACKKPPAPEPAREIHSTILGLWEGTDKKGDTLAVTFTKTGWECTKESNGSGTLLPYFKGTYTQEAGRLKLLVTHEGDLKTMGWRPEKGSINPNIVGSMSGRRLTVKALTDAELTKKM
jgi:hypothetical protein